MTPYFNFPTPLPQKSAPLTKSDIVKLKGGKYRGEQVFLVVDFGPTRGYVIYDVNIRNQRQSQRQVHPEGYLWLKSNLFGIQKQFRYDIATDKCCVPVPDVSLYSGNLYQSWRSFPSVLFNPRHDSEDAHLMRGATVEEEAREGLFGAIRKNPSDQDTIANLMAEALDIPKRDSSKEPSGVRIVRYLPYIKAAIADALREAVLTRGPSDASGLTLAAAA